VVSPVEIVALLACLARRFWEVCVYKPDCWIHIQTWEGRSRLWQLHGLGQKLVRSSIQAGCTAERD